MMNKRKNKRTYNIIKKNKAEKKGEAGIFARVSGYVIKIKPDPLSTTSSTSTPFSFAMNPKQNYFTSFFFFSFYCVCMFVLLTIDNKPKQENTTKPPKTDVQQFTSETIQASLTKFESLGLNDP